MVLTETIIKHKLQTTTQHKYENICFKSDKLCISVWYLAGWSYLFQFPSSQYFLCRTYTTTGLYSTKTQNVIQMGHI